MDVNLSVSQSIGTFVHFLWQFNLVRSEPLQKQSLQLAQGRIVASIKET